ncbi:unnamed protein product [Staurois parvus]|uniref:Uncharacterized protein n=1 Tax=Staurois parvus TaxID=386267 RepID=A0ABN9CIC8_9NEOB|nr:unnamed protein product [Staurois parvus]
MYKLLIMTVCNNREQARTDHLEIRALPKDPGCPWYLFHRLF